MKLNLGKIAIALFLCQIALFAQKVEALLDKSEIYKGDTVNLTIKANGDSVKFPDIKQIGGFDVLGVSNSQSTTIINGKISGSRSKSYTIAPKKSIKIPPFSVVVDSKVYKTKPLEVKVVKPTASTASSPFILRMKLEKNNIRVGESVRLDLIFKQKRGAKADKIELSPPKLENFWVKEIKGSKHSLEGDYEVTTYSYLLFAQKAGDYTIPAVVANIGKRVKRRNSMGGFSDPFFDDPFFNSFISSLEWKKIFSNEQKLHVKPLPGNLEVYGDFSIKAEVDKKEINAGKPVNLTVTIEGEGNIDDIKKFEIDIPDAVVYSDEPKIESTLKNGKYVGRFTQKTAIIADHDFTIPSLEFEYFDKNKQKRVLKKTAAINIKVKGAVKNKSVSKIETSKQIEKEAKNLQNPAALKQKSDNSYNGYIYLFVGILIGSVLTYSFLEYIPKKEKKEKKPVITRIKRAKNDKELYELLLPYASRYDYIKDRLKELERNIYADENNIVDKDEIVDFFEEMKIT